MFKFNRVIVDNIFEANTDGMLEVRKPSDIECLMSFYDDIASEKFEMFDIPFNFNIEQELTITLNGKPFRNTMEHEVLMKFDTKEDKDKFIKWWNTIGSIKFNYYLN
jgi:hypothetical protein